MGIPRNSVGWAVETWVVLFLLRQAQRIMWGKEGIDACYFSTTLVKGNKNKNDAVNLMKKDVDQASIYSTKEHHPFKCMHAIMQPSGTIKNYRLICDWCVHKQSNLLGYADMTWKPYPPLCNSSRHSNHLTPLTNKVTNYTGSDETSIDQTITIEFQNKNYLRNSLKGSKEKKYSCDICHLVNCSCDDHFDRIHLHWPIYSATRHDD